MRLELNERPYATAAPAVSIEGAYQPVSYWQETVSVDPGEPLAEPTDCDVVIVGGGYTGLSTAYQLKKAKPELDVVLLERGVVGHGASGRNGGFAMPLFGWDLLSTVKSVGEDKGGEVYRMMYTAVDNLRDVIQQEKIDCDAEYTGYILLATSASREPHLRKELEFAHRLGFEHQWIDGAALDEHIKSDAFRSGVFDPRPFIVNPAKLVRGLKDVVDGLGVRIYERTPVTAFMDGERVEARTPGGSVKADRAVMALNGYAGALGFQQHKVLPVHTYIVMTEPLTDEQLASIGWDKKRASLETARNFIHYFRLTVDNRIAFGGEDADLYYGGAFRDHDEAIYRRLEGKFREFFPVLRDIIFTHHWGGTLGVTLDMFPNFGVTGAQENVFYAMGYSGHGVALANFAGNILAPCILGSLGMAAPEDAATPFFYNRRLLPLPPDPLRFLGMKAYRLGLRLQDTMAGA